MIVTSYTRFVVESHSRECAGLARQARGLLRGKRSAGGRVEAYIAEALDLAPMRSSAPRRGVLTDVPVTRPTEVRGIA